MKRKPARQVTTKAFAVIQTGITENNFRVVNERVEQGGFASRAHYINTLIKQDIKKHLPDKWQD